MTEPRLNEDEATPSTESEIQGEPSVAPAVMPIAEDAAEPKAASAPIAENKTAFFMEASRVELNAPILGNRRCNQVKRG